VAVTAHSPITNACVPFMNRESIAYDLERHLPLGPPLKQRCRSAKTKVEWETVLVAFNSFRDARGFRIYATIRNRGKADLEGPMTSSTYPTDRN
jgi:hypothetical protein